MPTKLMKPLAAMLLTTTLACASGVSRNLAAQELSGPISGGGRGQPHAALPPDQLPAGYSETEWFLSGTATSYRKVGSWGTDGRWGAEPADRGEFEVRMLVRRPDDPSRFNGVVVVEWLNVTAQSEGAADYSQMAEELVREGYAWVGVGAQAVGVHAPLTGLEAWDPERYATLSHPGDRFSYDIFSGAARALRARAAGRDPLAGLAVARVVATGRSQSAFRLVTYVNAVHPLERLFDGYFIHSRGANAAGLTAEGMGADADAPVPAGAHIRVDLGVPVFDLQTEGDMVTLRSHLTRQPASSGYRRWEIAGAAHAEVPRWVVDEPPPLSRGAGCAAPVNAAPHDAVVKAGLRAFTRWVVAGDVPRQSPEIVLGDPAAADPIARDEHGNARGGIRLPHVEAPTATVNGLRNTVASPVAGQQDFCFLFGTTQPFDSAPLQALYPDHAAFVSAHVRAVDSLESAGYLLAPEADAARAAARESSIGRR